MPETTPLIKAALNLRVGAGFDVYTACDDMSLENHNMDLETTKNRLLLFNDTLQKKKGND